MTIYYKTLSQFHRLRHHHTVSARFPLTLPMGEATKNGPGPEGHHQSASLPNGHLGGHQKTIDLLRNHQIRTSKWPKLNGAKMAWQDNFGGTVQSHHNYLAKFPNLGDFVVQNRGWPPYRNLQKPLFFNGFWRFSEGWKGRSQHRFWLSQKVTGKREGTPGNLPGNFLCIFLLKKVTGNREAIS